MDYEKEYKEMVARAKELHESGNALTKKQMEIICPGLAESEDERIRKAIRLVLIATEDEQKDFYSTHGLTRKDCTDWLEKQKEGNLVDKKYVQEAFNKGMLAGMMQKPAEKPKLYDSMDEFYADALIEMVEKSDLIDRDKKNRLVWIEKHRVKPAEWSEEDKKMFNSLCTVLYGGLTSITTGQFICWLESLKERFVKKEND